MATAVISHQPQALHPSSSRTSNASDEKVDLPPVLQKTLSKGIANASHGHGRHASTPAPVDRAVSPKRWKQFCASFKYLYDMTPKQVEDFMDSYVIYNLDWQDEDEMMSALGPGYQKRVGDCLRSYYGVLNHL
jgi:sterol 24-C-methyltransferase